MKSIDEIEQLYEAAEQRPRHPDELVPGIYDVGDGQLHLDSGEYLRWNGYPDTPENRMVVAEEAKRIANRRGLVLAVW